MLDRDWVFKALHYIWPCHLGFYWNDVMLILFERTADRADLIDSSYYFDAPWMSAADKSSLAFLKANIWISSSSLFPSALSLSFPWAFPVVFAQLFSLFFPPRFLHASLPFLSCTNDNSAAVFYNGSTLDAVSRLFSVFDFAGLIKLNLSALACQTALVP